MEHLEEIKKWGEMSPGILALVRIGAARSNILRFLVVVEDHLHFIRKIEWIGNFGSVNKFHVRTISDNFHSMTVLYDGGGRATFLFLEPSDSSQLLTHQVSGFLEKGSQILVDKIGHGDIFLNYKKIRHFKYLLH